MFKFCALLLSTLQVTGLKISRLSSQSSSCECTAGEFCNDDGSCSACPAGSSCDGISATPCHEGYYSAASATFCSAMCPAGYYATEDSQACIECPPGSYRGADDAQFYDNTYIKCISCPTGTTSPLTAATTIDTCTPCPSGTFSNGFGGACLTCPEDTYFITVPETKWQTCYTCPEGATAAAGVTTECKCSTGNWTWIHDSDPSLFYTCQ